MNKTNSKLDPAATVDSVLAWLKRKGTAHNRAGMARYGLPSTHTFGVSMGTMQPQAKRIGRNHTLALALWRSGWYEARIMATFLADPAQLTVAQMNAWCRDFDNWGICDTVCFKLFDQVPLAYGKVKQWARREEEFIKRGAYALLACLALHDKQTDDEVFAGYLPLIESGAEDERNFVKKGVLWALRGIGTRSAEMKAEAIILAQRLAASPQATARWIGKTALRELARRK